MIRLRRTNDSAELLCAVPGCEATYAEVLADRLLIYLYHFRHQHTTAIAAPFFDELCGYAFDESGEKAYPAQVDCNCGRTPCVAIQPGQLVLASKHKTRSLSGEKGAELHVNAWGADEVAQVADLLGLAYVILRDRDDDLEQKAS